MNAFALTHWHSREVSAHNLKWFSFICMDAYRWELKLKCLQLLWRRGYNWHCASQNGAAYLAWFTDGPDHYEHKFNLLAVKRDHFFSTTVSLAKNMPLLERGCHFARQPRVQAGSPSWGCDLCTVHHTHYCWRSSDDHYQLNTSYNHH